MIEFCVTRRWSKRDSNLRSPEGVGGRSRQVRSPLLHVRSGCALAIYLESFLFNYQFADEINCSSMFKSKFIARRRRSDNERIVVSKDPDAWRGFLPAICSLAVFKAPSDS